MQSTGNRLEVCFACVPRYLDIYSISYRWFGAVWSWNEQLQQIVRRYWFGDEKEDVIRHAKYADWQSFIEKPWRTAESGWYILRSREQYPLYLMSVQKRGWLVYLMHTAVCENDTDKLNFINKVNCEHNIQLQECQWTGEL